MQMSSWTMESEKGMFIFHKNYKSVQIGEHQHLAILHFVWCCNFYKSHKGWIFKCFLYMHCFDFK